MEIGAPGILAQAPDASPVEPCGPNSVPYLPDKLEKTYTVELTEPPLAHSWSSVFSLRIA